ncbi:MAG: Bifunctional synthase/transferase [Candidatus Moranbacteria bacterium GW2011_GWE1_36_7]|nr:MAG: Bifunctional synthase/transferase [Candidatus Moranbacteria bacterium GW2011_GWD2_36_12]KKQ07079.1 MAG: Bifunctional synthase/transferase [Candidatus Moranbacteria bacterium GW2011_GWE2_36_40]KKQ13792.1 MAG: Bifunctional synthase/transferase [Candidatus Moranbacteria bacterium GW2011_GWE1_36_7]
MKKKIQERMGAFIESELMLGGKSILNNKRLKEIVGHCKGLGLKIVLTQGSWDLIHIGHARYMQEAKKYGDLLVVGVDSDEKIRSRKGPERPIVPQNERMEMITHLRHVDLVALKELHDPKWHMIKLVCPDVLIATKRQGYSKDELKELKKYCGKIVMLESQATTSTSAKIRSMQINTAKKLERSLTPKLLKAIEEAMAGVK